MRALWLVVVDASATAVGLLAVIVATERGDARLRWLGPRGDYASSMAEPAPAPTGLGVVDGSIELRSGTTIGLVEETDPIPSDDLEGSLDALERRVNR